MTGAGNDGLRAFAPRFAALAVTNVTTEFPYAPQHVVEGPADVALPRVLHPAFYGSYDWHSCVHMHWLLVHLLRRYPGEVAGEDVRRVLDAHLAPDALGVEAAYLRGHPSFERPYGWAWLAALAAECRLASDDSPAAGAWGTALGPAMAAVEDLVLDWLPRARIPVRHGTHANSAFAAGLLLDAAGVLGRDRLTAALRAALARWFLTDRDGPARWEPSGEDFLSPVLAEADAVRRLLGPGELAAWLDGFLPGLRDESPASLLAPVEVADTRDGRIGHLVGLNLSRAAACRALATRCPQPTYVSGSCGAPLCGTWPRHCRCFPGAGTSATTGGRRSPPGPWIPESLLATSRSVTETCGGVTLRALG